MNIIVRKYMVSDADDLAEMFSMPKAYAGTLQLPYNTPDSVRARFEKYSPDSHHLVAVVEETQKVVGNLVLHKVNSPRRAHVGGFGMAVHDDYQGQGVGTKLMAAAIDLADNWLNLTRLELEVFIDNPAAVQLYKKFGFEIEGTLRNYAFRNGEFVDTYAMARLKGTNDEGR